MGVLDDMTKGITDRKAKAAGPKLTPVGVEASGVKPSMPKDLPGRFMAAEEVTEIARDLRERAAQLTAIADALDVHAGETSQPVLNPKAAAAAELKVAEAEADKRVRAKAQPEPELPELDADVTEGFKERLDRLSSEAQAHAFAKADAGGESPFNDLPHERPAGWACPEHGTGSLKQLTSRRGRVYMACQTTGCREFERE